MPKVEFSEETAKRARDSAVEAYRYGYDGGEDFLAMYFARKAARQLRAQAKASEPGAQDAGAAIVDHPADDEGPKQ